MTPQKRLRYALAQGEIVVTPGVYDAFGAMMAEQAGFDAIYLSGASIAYTRLGKPDIGLVSMDEVANVISLIRERVDLPIVVDADTGFGNALNVQRCVRLFERNGASALQLEDQMLPKRCGHLKGKTLVSKSEMVGKIHAALDARNDEDTMIIARTDSVAVEGFDAALDRAESYVEAGADMLFIEALNDQAQMEETLKRFKGRIPVMANMVEGGKTPLRPAHDLQALGFSLVIFPGGLVRAIAKTASTYFASLKEHGTTEPNLGNMLNFDDLNTLLGTADILEAGKKYEGEKTS